MRLPDVGEAIDFNEKIALRRRFDELSAAHVNTLILSAAQAEMVLGIAEQAGLRAMVEIAIEADELAAPKKARATRERVAQAMNLLRGFPALIGIVIDCRVGGGGNFKSRGAVRKALDAIVRAIRASNEHLLVGLKRDGDAQEISRGGEDFAYRIMTRLDQAAVGTAIRALHDRAGARPLVMEFGEGFPGEVEAVACAFGSGAAGVVAAATRPAASRGWHNVRMLSAGELLPFVHLGATAVPTPAATPLISVVVTARDDERNLALCLESIKRLQYPNYEVIVIDEGSRDRSVEIAAAARGSVRLIRRPRSGPSDPGIAAMRVARGELIAFTRADCVMDPDWLTLAVHTIREGGLAGCCGPTYASQEQRGFAARARAALGSGIAERGGVARINPRNLVVCKSSLIAVGGVASGLGSRFDGAGDFLARRLAAGTKIGWCPASLVWRSGRSTIGEIARAIVRRHYPFTTAGAAAKRASREDGSRPGERFAIGNAHARMAHPINR